jgi:hypothetical protein
MQHCFSHDDSSTSFVLRQPERLLPSHTMKTATRSYALRRIAGSVAPPLMDFGSCVKSQAVGPRGTRVTFVNQLRLIGRNDSRRFSERKGNDVQHKNHSDQGLAPTLLRSPCDGWFARRRKPR